MDISRLMTRAPWGPLLWSLVVGVLLSPQQGSPQERASPEIQSKADGVAAADPSERIHRKLETMQRLVPKWLQSGGRPDEIGSRMQKFQERMQSGHPKDAEAQLDDILAILGHPPAKAPAGRN